MAEALVETSFSSRNPDDCADENQDDELNEEDDAVFERHRLCKTTYTHFHLVVFIITYMCNVIVHINRKSLGTVESVLAEEWTPSLHNSTRPKKLPDDVWNTHTFFSDSDSAACKNFLGGLHTAFMASYAIGLFFSGQIGDRYDLRYVLATGFIGAFAMMFLFACLGEWFQLYYYYWYMPLWILNGFFQSANFPCIVAIMGNWFDRSHRGTIFGIWATSSSVGNILGSIFVASLINFGYEVAMGIPSAIACACGIIVLFGLVTAPSEVGIVQRQKKPLDNDRENEQLISGQHSVKSYNSTVATTKPTVSGESKTPKKKSAIKFSEAIMLPGVISYSIAFGGIRFVHYAFFFWLPLYLNRQYHWSPTVAGQLSAWYDVGGIFGTMVGGFLSDKIRRSPVLMTMLALAIPLLFIYQTLPDDMVVNSIMLVAIGFCIGGVAGIMSSGVAADLGNQPRVKSDSSALATVTGIMDGIGSTTAAVGQVIVPVVQDGLGWNAVFYFFIIACALTFMAFIPIIYREIKETNVWQNVKQKLC